jgi:predicted RNase H-like HicB family nuclease
MNELIFIIEDAIDGGLTTRCLNESIFTEGETMDELKANIREAVQCHFDDAVKRIVRLHYVKEELMTA